MTEETEILRTRIRDLEMQVAHWKANSTEMAARNAVLRDRPDLPVDRVPALARLERLHADLSEERRRVGAAEATAASLDAAKRAGAAPEVLEAIRKAGAAAWNAAT